MVHPPCSSGSGHGNVSLVTEQFCCSFCILDDDSCFFNLSINTIPLLLFPNVLVLSLQTHKAMLVLLALRYSGKEPTLLQAMLHIALVFVGVKISWLSSTVVLGWFFPPLNGSFSGNRHTGSKIKILLDLGATESALKLGHHDAIVRAFSVVHLALVLL